MVERARWVCDESLTPVETPISSFHPSRGVTLAMIEQHYGDSRMSHAELDTLIDDTRDIELGTHLTDVRLGRDAAVHRRRARPKPSESPRSRIISPSTPIVSTQSRSVGAK